MNSLIAGNWPMISAPASVERERFHRIALAEAKVATDYHGREFPAAPSVVERLQSLFRREPACVDCAVAA